MYKIVSICIPAIFAATILSTPSEARLPDVAPGEAVMPYWLQVDFGAKGAVPLGFYNLCVRGNAICVQTRAGIVPATPDGAIRLTASLRGELDRVNDLVNQSMRPVPDGRRDVWQVGGKRGDCEDFALTKKAKLMEAGLPTSALLIALAVTHWGAQHAVLIVRTDHGDLVLDSLDRRIREWTPTLYKWTEVQSPTETWGWYDFGAGKLAVDDNGEDFKASGLALLASARAKVSGAIEAWGWYDFNAGNSPTEASGEDLKASVLALVELIGAKLGAAIGPWLVGAVATN